MRELYAGVSQRFSFGKLAKILKRNSQKLRTVVAVMAMMVVSCGLWAQTTYTYSKVTAEPADWSGDYIIVAGDKAFNGVIESNWGKFVAVEDSEGIIEMDEDISVTVAQSEVDDSKYTIYLNATSTYLAEVTSNAIAVADDASADTEWEFSLDNNGQVAVACASNNDRHMRCNGTNGFRCYASTTGTKPFLYKKLPAESSTLSVIADLSEFSYNIGNGPSTAQSFAVSGSNLTADITVSVPEDADFELCSTEDGTYASSVTITPSEGTVSSTDVFVRMKAGLDVGAYNATITIASTNATSKTINLTGSVVDPDAVYYTVVTEAPATDWTGEYLITNTNGSVVKALAGSSETSTNYGTEQDVSDYLVGNKITANATTDAIKVTARSTSNGYTLYLENVGYLGWNSSNSLEFDEDVTDGRNEWTFSVSGEVVSITNVGTDTRSIKYNGSTNPKRFACYTSGQSAITLYKSPREVQELIANPTFNPAEGTFFNSVDVTLACETEGTTIYYTLDDTDPTDASTAYTEAIHITETATVKAIAIKNGASSEIVSATYTISNIETVATPVIAPEAGNYNTPQLITITCATDEAIIYYTTDGTDPTAESTPYNAPFTLDTTATVKAIAVKEGMNNSQIASAAYTMPVFLENLAAVYSTANNDQYKITGDVVFVFRDHRYMFVKDATAGMMIFDNNDSIITTEYNEGDVISGGIMGKTSIFRGLYEVVPTANLAVSTENNGPVEPIVVTIPQMSNENDFMSQLVTVQNLTVTGIDGQSIIVSDGENTMKIFDRFNLITESDYIVDDVITSVTGLVSKYNSDYQIFPRTAEDIVKREVPAEPTFTPAAGTYVASVTVTLTCETEGATIYYNIEPNDAQLEYTEPLTFNDTTTINAFAEKDGLRSTVVTATYNITDREIVATPTITPNGGNFEESVEVTLACETADAAIHYTTDGTDPTAESTLYDAPFTLNATTIVKAIAVKDDMENSAVAEATFTKQPSALTFTKIASHDLITTEDIYMIVDVHSGKALTSANGSSSAPDAVDVTIVNDTIISGVIADELQWKFAEEEGGYRIYPKDDTEKWLYSISDNNGVRVGTNENKVWEIDVTSAEQPNYHGLMNVALSRYLGVYNNVNWRTYTTIHNNIANSQIEFFVLGEPTPVVATPTFSVEEGIYTTEQSVEISCATEGATIRYTLDGADPTEESDEYTAALTITEPTTVKAKAYKQDCIASGIAEAFYNVITTPVIIVDAETLNFENANETKTLNVSSLNLTENIMVTVTENFTVDTESITMNSEATLTVTFTGSAATTGTLTLISGETVKTVALVATPVVAVNYTRITSLDQLRDGDKVIIASRYDDNASHYYVAPTTYRNASSSNQKIYGTAIVAESTSEGYKITTDVDSIVWTVNIVEGSYTFTNVSNNVIGWSNGSNWSYTNNTSWNISECTAGANSYVPNYAGFKVANSADATRAIALRNNTDHWFAPYSYGSNSNNGEYNFAIDLFVDITNHTPIVARPTITPNGGNFLESIEVTLACATEDAAIYYTLDGETPTTESTLYVEPFTLAATTTVKAIAVKEGMDNSVVVVATFTKVVPNSVENIAALYEIENTTETYILTGDVTFVYRNGKSIYVKDATGGLLVFDQSNVITTEYTEGDVISGGVIGNISIYHGMLEFVPTFNTAASTQNTGAVAPTVITVEQLLSNDYVSQLVKVENVAVATGTTYTEGQPGDNVTFSQNGSSALLRNNFKTLDMTIGDNTNWDITGFAAIYDENIQIFPRDNDDVTIVTSVDELASEIAIYPNPTSDIVNIVTDGNAQRVEIANVDGQIVSSEAVDSDVVTISLEAQPAGMYFVRIYTANEVIVRKVTKF